MGNGNSSGSEARSAATGKLPAEGSSSCRPSAAALAPAEVHKQHTDPGTVANTGRQGSSTVGTISSSQSVCELLGNGTRQHISGLASGLRLMVNQHKVIMAK